MIRVEIAGQTYNIPSKATEVTAKQLHSIRSDKPKEVIKALTDVPDHILNRLHSEAVLSLYDLLSFVYDPPHNPKLKEEINVGSEAWLKLELARQAMQINVEPYIIVEVSRIYFGDQVFEWPFNYLYGQTSQIIQSMSVFLERYKELTEDNEPDADQLEAGIKGLESFGVGAIRYSLAQGDVTKYEQVEQMSAESIYFTLLYEKAKNEYTERLKEIYDRQNGINTRKNS
jgi:hypothetical protein